MGAEAKEVAVLQPQHGVIGLAELARAFDNGLENRPDFGRRGSDHPENIGAACLVNQRFGELAGLGLHLVEQADILDGDHGLVGKSLKQGNLPRGEGYRFQATEYDRTNGLSLPQKRYAEATAVSLFVRLPLPLGKLGGLGSLKVGYLHRYLVDDRATGDPLPVDR